MVISGVASGGAHGDAGRQSEVSAAVVDVLLLNQAPVDLLKSLNCFRHRLRRILLTQQVIFSDEVSCLHEFLLETK